MTEQELAAVRYARQFYELLKQGATEELADGNEIAVWRGKLTVLFKQLSASSKYYTPVRSVLTRSGAITIVEAGSRNRDSIVVLNFPPPEDLQKIYDLGIQGTRPSGMLLADIQRRISALEAWRETQGGLNIAEALRNIEERLTKLEGKK